MLNISISFWKNLKWITIFYFPKELSQHFIEEMKSYLEMLTAPLSIIQKISSKTGTTILIFWNVVRFSVNRFTIFQFKFQGLSASRRGWWLTKCLSESDEITGKEEGSPLFWLASTSNIAWKTEFPFPDNTLENAI